MTDVKVFAMYLPQYHETQENSQFWGKGFTDWVSVKNATPLFLGHRQPQVPLDNNYYDLSNVESIRWQARLARKFGVSGWGIYHYWFNSEQKSLTKPAELLLEHQDIDIPFFFAWDNASWKRTWSKIKGNAWSPLNDKAVKDGPEILIEYKLGGVEDWKKHFDYLLPYFKDTRYVKHNNKPIFLIYNFSKDIMNMQEYWNDLAIQSGFDGVEVIYSFNPLHGIPKSVKKFKYEPLYSGWGNLSDRARRLLLKKSEDKQSEIKKYSYDEIWDRLLSNAEKSHDPNMYYGAFVGYDDSPRRGEKGRAVVDATPEKFQKYLSRLISICENKSKPFIFLTAWNEWGEGAHLEPDNIDQYSYLEAYSRAIGIR